MQVEDRLKVLEDQSQRRCHYLVPRENEPGNAHSAILPAPLTVSLVGCGYKGGQPIYGVEKGPGCLRMHELTEEIKHMGWGLNDLGDISVEEGKWNPATNDPQTETGVKNPRQVGEATKKLHDAILPNLGKSLILTVGGDHSLAIGSLSAALSYWKDLRIIWVDAHGDINTDKSSLSGNIHGMPVAFLAGLMSAPVPGFEWLTPCLKPEQICYIGLRHVDYEEKKIIQDKNIKAFSLREVDKYGIGAVMDMAFAYLDPEKKGFPIHLSFDIDSIDPFVCPSTGTRVGGGLTYREACYVCEATSESGRLVGIDLVELNPDIGTKEDVHQSAEVTLSLLRSCLGHELLNIQL